MVFAGFRWRSTPAYLITFAHSASILIIKNYPTSQPPSTKSRLRPKRDLGYTRLQIGHGVPLMLTHIQAWFSAACRKREPCFHCGEPIYQLVTLEFAGQTRHLCCHGCQAVLQTIQESGQTGAYLSHPSRMRAST